MADDASAAVPDLNQIVAEPFAPIRIGRDDKREVLTKSKSILIKCGALDALGAMARKPHTSTTSVIEWSLLSQTATSTRCQRFWRVRKTN